MPAKIIKSENSRYEVMFFGNKHEKGIYICIIMFQENILVWLDRTQIQNLDLSSIKDKKSLVIKTAVAEVSEHIKNVKKRFGNEILKKLKFERFAILWSNVSKHLFEVMEWTLMTFHRLVTNPTIKMILQIRPLRK